MLDLHWAIYYSDGSSMGSNDATPFSIEHREDVQVIIQEDQEHKWISLSGSDFYYWDDKGYGPRWWRADRQGRDHYLRQPGSKCILFGTWIETVDFRKIFNQAREDFGNKEIFDPYEKKP